jgi:hypothetical protein
MPGRCWRMRNKQVDKWDIIDEEQTQAMGVER